MKLEVELTPHKVTKLLLLVVSILLVANLLGIYLKLVYGFNTGFSFIPMFDFDKEYNIPTMYSSLAILLCAALLWYIALDKNSKSEAQSKYWKALSIIFVILSIDELASLHNQASRITEVLFMNVPGVANEKVITHSRYWILSFIPLLLLMSGFFIRFFFKLPSQTKVTFLIAGIVFVSGAVGVELVGDRFVGKGYMKYALLYTVEELLEMLGIVLFVRALVQYIAVHLAAPQVNIQVRARSAAEDTLSVPQPENKLHKIEVALILK